MFKLLRVSGLAAVLLLAACVAPKNINDSKETKLQATPADKCSLEHYVTLAEKLLSSYRISTPVIVTDAESSEYGTTTGVVYLETCAPDKILAHELGHYAFDVFVGFDYGQHTVKAQELFCPDAPNCPGSWGPADENTPGIEVAAHCLSEVFYQRTDYTECPDRNLLEKAKQIMDSMV